MSKLKWLPGKRQHLDSSGSFRYYYSPDIDFVDSTSYRSYNGDYPWSAEARIRDRWILIGQFHTATEAKAALNTFFEEIGLPLSLNDILESLTLYPCHVTGCHDPTHTPKYICLFQIRHAFKSLLSHLNIKIPDLPRQLHGGDCYWCDTKRKNPDMDELQNWVKNGFSDQETNNW